MVLKYPISTEKSIKLLETENKIVFVVDRRASKKEIKEEFEKTFNVKVKGVNTLIRENKKFAYIKLMPEYKAINIATKLGLI